jgi:hypothetical protein
MPPGGLSAFSVDKPALREQTGRELLENAETVADRRHIKYEAGRERT